MHVSVQAAQALVKYVSDKDIHISVLLGVHAEQDGWRSWVDLGYVD